MSGKTNVNMQSMTVDELEKQKLIEEIKEIQRPAWKKLSTISVVSSLLFTAVATAIAVWEVQETKIDELKRQQSEIAKQQKDIEKKEQTTAVQYNEAVAEKASALSEKAEAISERTISEQKIQNWELLKREEELTKSINKLEEQYEEKLKKALADMASEMEKKSKDYKIGFITAFVDSNQTVRADIERFSNEANREKFETWLKRDLLFTALTRYQGYILKEIKDPKEK